MKLKKLSLQKMEIKTLSDRDLNQVLGGAYMVTTGSNCFSASTSSAADKDNFDADGEREAILDL